MSSSRSQARTRPKRHARCLRLLKRRVLCSWKPSTIGNSAHILVFDRVLSNVPGRFHPSTRRVKEIVDSGELGDITKIEASLAVPAGFVKDSDIRLEYDL